MAAIYAISLSRSGEFIQRYMAMNIVGPIVEFKSDSRVNAILEETHGALIYQETFIRIAHEIAGMDIIDIIIYYRYLGGNRNKEMIDKFYREFELGCQQHSTLCREDFEELECMIKANVIYLFPKHVCLKNAIVGYWSAYFKVHFPEVFGEGFSG